MVLPYLDQVFYLLQKGSHPKMSLLSLILLLPILSSKTQNITLYLFPDPWHMDFF